MSSPGLLLAGRYRLEGRIASGGAGEVWRAADLVLGRPVAVKVLHAGYAGHPETLARFRAEARNAGALSHPGIAHVYDYGEADPAGSPYLVMELVDGPSLAGVLASGPLSPADAMDVAAQAAAGLAVAHAAGVVHRDIKPGNLLLGTGRTVKIADFGIAYAAGSAPITSTGTLVGTPAYLAPERAAGASATPASDLYSLGIVTYECLAGAPPFHGTPLEVVAACQHHPLPPLPPDVPAAVAALVSELTAKDPAARPASAGEVAARAGRLRDAMAGGAAIPLTFGSRSSLVSGSYPPSAAGPDAQPTTPGAQPATLVWGQVPGFPPAHRRARPGWAVPRRGGALAVAGVAVAAGLAGWLLAGVSGAAPQRHQAAATPAAPAASAPAARMVEVSGAAMAGRPADAVLRQLRQLGLRPRVVLVNSERQPPGTVVSVQPAGEVMTGSIVTVTVAHQSHRHGHGHSGGNRSGN